MDALIIEPTDDTPAITLDKENNKFEFSGKSLPEDVSEFYNPVLEWLLAYSQDPNPETIVNFRMEYFNSASSKQILDILTVFEDINNKGKKVHVKWYFQEDDEDMEEAGESYGEIIDLPVEIIAYE